MSSQSSLSRNALFAALVASLGSSVIYILTMSRSVGWHDSSELALTAWLLAANHAPGSPVHSLLGHLFAQGAPEPHIGTTFLSVAAASGIAGVVAALTYFLQRHFWVAVLVALLFAFSFQVWASAVVTEIYTLGGLFLAAALLCAWVWRGASATSAFIAMTGFYCFALGAYFANILLWPVFAWFIYRVSGGAFRLLVGFAVVTGCAVLAIALANYALAINGFPYGVIYPDTLFKMLMYMSGSQHEPFDAGGLSVLPIRFLEHAEIFVRSTGYAMLPAALLGIVVTGRQDRVYGNFLAGIFAVYILYYTIFGPGDYFLMVLPAYFVFAIWAGQGVVWILRWAAWPAAKLAIGMLLVSVVAGLVLAQFEGRRAMAASMEAEEFARDAFVILPPDALVIAGWRELTTLTYLQQVEGQRPDLNFILPSRGQRYYTHGLVPDYLERVDDEICNRAVYTMKRPAELEARYQLVSHHADGIWVELLAPETCAKD